jgi:sterol desaturase/sphingolipid hydroxylase (fatty acid hydroxylase superfamily)
MPAAWLCTTVFAAGLLSALWHGGTGPGAWALAGFAGVLMQNATFAVVEALRFGMASAARDGRSIAGLWSLSNVLFGFNQVFLAIALAGFSAAGAGTGLISGWRAWLAYASAALLFISASASPYNTDGNNRIALAGLIGWLGWATWIVACSITLIQL